MQDILFFFRNSLADFSFFLFPSPQLDIYRFQGNGRLCVNTKTVSSPTINKLHIQHSLGRLHSKNHPNLDTCNPQISIETHNIDAENKSLCKFYSIDVHDFHSTNVMDFEESDKNCIKIATYLFTWHTNRRSLFDDAIFNHNTHHNWVT